MLENLLGCDGGDAHPKLIKLQEILIEFLGKEKNQKNQSKVMVFT